MRYARYTVVMAALVAVSACATKEEIVQHRENLLAAAGFDARPASTPARQSQLATLPADKMIQQAKNGQIVYIYADPLICHCVYVGGQQAWSRYQQERLQRRLANEQVEAAQMNDESFDGGVWGGFGGPGFY